MKKLIIITIFSICPYIIYGQQFIKQPKQSKADKKYSKIIEKLDIIKYLNIDTVHNENAFWETIEQHHTTLNKYKKAKIKNKSSANKAIEYIGKQLADTDIEEYYIYDVPHITNNLKNAICGINSQYPVTISIVEDKYANAAIFPNGEMYITDSLLHLLDYSYEKLVGICAHEMGHYIIQHAYIHQWKSYKKQITNTIIAATMSAAVAASDIYAASQGVEVDADGTSKYINDTFIEANYSSYLYKFKYSREQELEADIIAIRFLEWIGINPKYYIDVLRQLGTKNDHMYNAESNHPTTKYRIDLLTYCIEKYPMTNQ